MLHEWVALLLSLGSPPTCYVARMGGLMCYAGCMLAHWSRGLPSVRGPWPWVSLWFPGARPFLVPWPLAWALVLAFSSLLVPRFWYGAGCAVHMLRVNHFLRLDAVSRTQGVRSTCWDP